MTNWKSADFMPVAWSDWYSRERKPEWRHDPDRHVSWYAVYRVGMRHVPHEEALRRRLCLDHELVYGQTAAQEKAEAEAEAERRRPRPAWPIPAETEI